MARGTQFLALVQRLRDETGRSGDTSIGPDDVESLKTILNRWYEALWYDYDWPHLKITFDRDELSAGENMYDFPDGLDLERVESVVVWYQDIARPVERGISLSDYNLWNPVDDARSDPVLKWDVRNLEDAGGSVQIEVWPMPASTQYLQFIGFRQFSRLVADADLCHLDDNIVVSFAAAQILRRQKSEDADDMLSFANSHYNKLRGRGKAPMKRFRLGLDATSDRPHPRAIINVSS
jgi:hypothetical protein